VSNFVYALLAISMVLTLVSLLVPLAERLRLPHTVLLAIAGMGLGFVGAYVIASGSVGLVHDVFAGLDRLELRTEFFLPLFLPPLLFNAGLTIDVRRLFDEVFAVLLLAIVAVLVCIGVVAAVVHEATGIDVLVCLLLGAIVSTTDPAAVIGIFRDVGAPKRLSILAEGESLFNDAVAISTFAFVVELLAEQAAPGATPLSSAIGPVLHFLREFVGGILFGFLIARAAIFILPRLNDSDAAIASVTVSLAYLSYVVADHYLSISGVVSVVMAALTVAAYGPTHLHPKQWTALRQVWTQLEFWSNCLIFILASMLAANVLPQISWLYVWALVAVVCGAMLARLLVVFGMLPVLEAWRLVQPVDKRYKAILVWGGLRGAVTIVLAMVVFSDGRLSEDVRQFAAVVATLFVMFTLFVNATTLGLVMRLLGLDQLTPVELALRDRVLALSKVNVARQIQEIIRTHNERVEGLDVDPLSAGEPEAAAPPPDLALELGQRLTVGLLTVSTQEKELYFKLFDQQTLSRRMVAALTARADRLIDAVRDRGMAGYEATAHGFALPTRVFSLALWLHRTFGYERALTEQLADRFEILMVSQDVLADVTAFNNSSVADLLGADAAMKVAEVILDRQQLVDRALTALSLQYPGYAELVKQRELERASIRFESLEYTRRLDESIISREVYADLRGELAKRRNAVIQRPPLDLGLELERMIGQVSLFVELDKASVREVGRRLRALVAMPGEKIITRGSKSDAMYFIAAGGVTVSTATGPIVLHEGEFFGEMGLLDARPRNADVASNGYCHLLVLYRKDFDELLARKPEIRAEIEAVAARRIADTPSTWEQRDRVAPPGQTG
jgi:CPA1 family monovalent cation:H+ antiporter